MYQTLLKVLQVLRKVIGSDVDFVANHSVSQALAMADIGLPEIAEDTDYGNQNGISIGKIMGLKKPVYNLILLVTKTSVIGVDCAF